MEDWNLFLITEKVEAIVRYNDDNASGSQEVSRILDISAAGVSASVEPDHYCERRFG